MTEFAAPSLFIPSFMRQVRHKLVDRTASWADRRYQNVADRLVQELARTRQLGDINGAPCILSLFSTRSDIVVAMVGDSDARQAKAVLKLPLTTNAARSITCHRVVTDRLHALLQDSPVQMLIPKSISSGNVEGQQYLVETALSGNAASRPQHETKRGKFDPESAAEAILQLHAGTKREVCIDYAAFMRLAGVDLETLMDFTDRWPETALLKVKIEQMREMLQECLLNKVLSLSWIHGDYWSGNILYDTKGVVSGIVDWDRAIPDDLPLHDILHLIAYTRKLKRRTKLGEEVVSYLLPLAFDAQDRRLLDSALSQLHLPGDDDFLRAAILLYWIRFAATNLKRYPAFRTDPRWLNKNVFNVLKQGIK